MWWEGHRSPASRVTWQTCRRREEAVVEGYTFQQYSTASSISTLCVGVVGRGLFTNFTRKNSESIGRNPTPCLYTVFL